MEMVFTDCIEGGGAVGEPLKVSLDTPQEAPHRRLSTRGPVTALPEQDGFRV